MAEKDLKRTLKRHDGARLAILVSLLLILTAFGLLHQYGEAWRPVGVDALCPFGGLESFLSVILTGKMLQRIAVSSFILLGITIITALVFRRAFCGYICPLGTLQELSRKLGKIFIPKKYQVPQKLDRIARYLKYLVLVGVIVFSVLLGELVIRPFDPWVAWHHMTSTELFSQFVGGFVILLVSLLASTVYDRFFCKYLCPMGAFLGLVGKIGYFRIKRNITTCTNCSACSRACPVDIPVASLLEVKTAECISCNLCVTACPEKSTLEQRGPKTGKIAPLNMLLAVIGISAVLLIITTVTGDFPWDEKSIEKHAGEKGIFKPDDITGSDTFPAVSAVSGIPKEAFMEKFKLSEEDWKGTIRTFVHKPGSTLEVSAIREFVKEKMKK